MKTIYHIAALLMLLAFPAVSQEKYVRTVEKHFDVNASPTVRIDSRFGSISVKTSERQTVDVKVEIKAEDESLLEAKRLAEKANVDIRGTGTDVGITVDIGAQSNNRSRFSIASTIIVTVPKKTILTARNQFGGTTVNDVEGGVHLEGQFGSIELTRCTNVDVKNAFGNITLNSIRGAMNVEGKNGKIRAYDVQGGEIRNAFGEIEVSGSKSPLTIVGKMGAIKVIGIPGGRITNSYGSTAVTLIDAFDGTIEAKTRFGSVDSQVPLQSRNEKKESSFGLSEKDLFGKTGDGSGRLTVVNEFGDISIRKK